MFTRILCLCEGGVCEGMHYCADSTGPLSARLPAKMQKLSGIEIALRQVTGSTSLFALSGHLPSCHSMIFTQATSELTALGPLWPAAQP